MSSHILGEVDLLATRIGIVHRGKLIEELDSEALERHRDRRLEVRTRDVETARAALDSAGYGPIEDAADQSSTLLLRATGAVDAPDEVAAVLVRAGAPPTHLAVVRESLEDHFMRLTGATEEAA
jgi:ABC-2 type transport system ATP-binding protein